MQQIKLIFLSVTLSFVAFGNGNSKAEAIAHQSKSVHSAHQELIKLVEKMKTNSELPDSLKKASLSLLGAKGSPRFQFEIASRKHEEKEILSALNQKLAALMGENKPFETGESEILFSPYPQMSFITAPGSAMGGHHVYPGGLVHHTYTNVQTALRLAETYEKAYQIKLSQTEKDLAALAAIWHDAAKTWVMEWKEDGSLTQKEGKIAGTSAHHIWGIAELLKREAPTDFVVAVAGAHDAVMESQPSEKKVIGYLLAASVIAGKPETQAGLKVTVPPQLASLPTLIHYLNHLSDADWVISVPAQKKALELVSQVTDSKWKALNLLSEHGEIPLYRLWKREGDKAVLNLLKKTAK